MLRYILTSFCQRIILLKPYLFWYSHSRAHYQYHARTGGTPKKEKKEKKKKKESEQHEQATGSTRQRATSVA